MRTKWDNRILVARLSELCRRVAAGALRPDEFERELEDVAGSLADLLTAQPPEPAWFIAAPSVADQIHRRAASAPAPSAVRAL
jgi:hypothetical protein